MLGQKMTVQREEGCDRMGDGPYYRVVLHDDNINSLDKVVKILMAIYSISSSHALLIAEEAGRAGMVECCIECSALAVNHYDMMSTLGLKVSLLELSDDAEPCSDCGAGSG